MPLFRYTSLTLSGKKQMGIIDADTMALAKERLVKDRIFVTGIKPFEEKGKKAPHLKSADLLDFTRDLAGLLRAGLPLYEGLVTIQEKYIRHKAHALFLDLSDRVKNGSQLSAAMKEYPKTFNQLYLSMCAAGEESGSLGTVFEELAALIGRQQKLKKQIGSALIYPAFLGSFCLIVLAALFFFLIPSMQELYEGRSLHPLTNVILTLSNWMQSHALTLFASLLITAAGLTIYFRGSHGQLVIKRLLLKMPFVKTVITESVLIRFCRALSVLQMSGVSFLKALGLSRKVMNHPIFEEVIVSAEKDVMEGKKISDQFKSSQLIPPLVSRMLELAEETGKSSQMLANIADIYEDNLEKSLTRFTTLLQPVMLLILGVIVGVILLAVLLPLTDVSSFIN